ncbi:MAG: hypothetical protein IJ228_05260 [Succinivibrio sp.]|nr:hypothetical protein [Succinivibrio sp.]
MHIDIAPDIVDAVLEAAQGETTPRATAAVRVIRAATQALERGTHLITMTAEDLARLRAIKDKFFGSEWCCFEIIEDHLPELQALLNTLRVHVQLGFADQGRLGERYPHSHNVFINPTEHARFNCAVRSSLVAEDLTDCDFFCCIARSYLYWQGLEVGLEVKAVNGGGSTIAQAVRHELEDAEHAVLALADSDKRYPEDEPHATARSLLNPALLKYDLYGQHIVSAVTEAENLIPFKYLTERWHKHNRIVLGCLADLLHGLRWTPDFLDLKKGLSFEDLLDEQVASYWCSQWQCNLQQLKLCLGCDTGSILEGVSSASSRNKIISTLLEKYTKELSATAKSELSEAQLEEWREIGQAVLDWCCCYAERQPL